MTEPFICDAIRTPIGRYGGSLSSVRTDDLGAVPIPALIARNPTVDWAAVDDLSYGCANQAREYNRNVARMSGLPAGLPVEVAGATINRLCGSGMDAVGAAARAIKCGEAELMIAGGVESMSRAPFVSPKAESAFSRCNAAYDTTIGWHFVNRLMKERYGVDSMPERAENVATDYRIEREAQDRMVLASRLKAVAAQQSGLLDVEITPVMIVQKKGDPLVVSRDEHPRDTSLEVLARLKGIGPAPATRKVLALTGLTLEQMDVIELNEAFAAQGLAVLRDQGLTDDDPRVNPNGGAIAPAGHDRDQPVAQHGRSLRAVHDVHRRRSGHRCRRRARPSAARAGPARPAPEGAGKLGSGSSFSQEADSARCTEAGAGYDPDFSISSQFTMAGGASWVLSQVQVVAEAVATVAFALSGVIEGARKRLDAVGICVVGGLAAFGGGTVRDVVLDRRPLFWVQHAGWLWALLALCIAAMVFMRARHLEPTERAMQWPDAIGLGLFTASGTQIALDSGMPAIVAVLLGMVTAVFGGVLRDVVCNEIPRAFNDHRPYAICSFAGGWVMVATDLLAQPGWVSLTAAAVAATGLRVAAVAWDWRLPAWQASRGG